MAELSPTAYLVLALLEQAGEATPYDLKKMASAFEDIWSVRHDQAYREPARLVQAGLVAERREPSGRRRRNLSLTAEGRAALKRWRSAPQTEFTQLRDEALLKLAFGAPPAKLAEAQIAVHAAKLAEYEALAASLDAGVSPGLRLTLQAGIGHEREWVRFWTSVRGG